MVYSTNIYSSNLIRMVQRGSHFTPFNSSCDRFLHISTSHRSNLGSTNVGRSQNPSRLPRLRGACISLPF
uniref:Uncharacterized protein n=1 Tax=Anguilla anguilla TaxID=7936 RepID=A0A0E9SH22_ANGAN